MPAPHLVRIHPDDNVLVLARTAPAGAELVLEGEPIRLETGLGLGHKIAARDIAQSDKIIKYGMPIGSATRDIARGEHIHLHNMASDYLPVFTHEKGREYEEKP